MGQDNISILQNRMILSHPQHSTYYNASSITDGMGNKASFEYDYLVNNPKKSNIYSIDNIGLNLGFEIYNNTSFGGKWVRSK